MIRIFSPTDRIFSSNGDVVLKAVKAKVHKEDNIHLNEALGWNRLNISQFTSDGLHPNADGDKMLASFICSEIKKHC